MLLLIDNYDSFTFNLVQYFQCLQQDVCVYPNDGISIERIKTLSPSYIVLSPGPNGPKEAGISLEIIRQLHTVIPILGVCLGHQCLAQAFGGQIIRAPEIYHGKTSVITHQKRGLFYNLPASFSVMRYHSLTIDPQKLPTCLQIDAVSGQTIMAISHTQYPLYGVQFHPESILSEQGMALLHNFLFLAA